ncbi:MAG: cupin domain-containing protein [Negativicutes bacterium]
MKKLITETELRALAGEAKQVVIPADSILTPSALDMAKFMNLTITRAEAVSATSSPSAPLSSCGEASDDEIRRIVHAVLEQKSKPACPNPRVTVVRGSSVKLEPFDKAPPGQIIHMTDVVTAREGNLAAGFMTFEKSELPWHLTYDEVDYVVEGTFTLKANGKTYTCQAGDVLYIPKDTHVVFGSPTQTRVLYVTYPANWAEV